MTPNPDFHAGLPFQPFGASAVGFFCLLISFSTDSLFTLMDYSGDGSGPILLVASAVDSI